MNQINNKQHVASSFVPCTVLSPSGIPAFTIATSVIGHGVPELLPVGNGRRGRV